MKCTAVLIAIVLGFLLCSGTVRAQDTAPELPLMRLVTHNGEVFDGYVLQRKADTLHFETLGGVQLTLPVSQVRQLGAPPGEGPVTDATAESERDTPRPPLLIRPASSLFVLPTAYPLENGEVHLNLSELIFASGSVGLGGFADLSLGTIILPGAIFRSYIAGLKISPLNGKAGALAFGGGIGGFEDDHSTMLYATGTVSLESVWISGGFTMDDEFEDGIATIGFDLPISSVTRLMSEIWIPLEAEGIMFSFGARVETELMYIDFGMYIPTTQGGSDYFMFLPWINGTFLL